MITKKDIRIIRENYHARDHNNDYDDNNLGFGLIHYALIRNLKPKHILVIGSQRGYIPAICALACKHNKRGMVHFVDAGYNLKHPKAWGGLGIWKDATQDYWKPLGVEEYIKLYNMTSKDFHGKNTTSFDYIYIDGDHSYEGVKNDCMLFWERLKEKGLMLLHDVTTDKTTDYGKCGVKRFWQELTMSTSLNIPITRNRITIYRSAGLGILQK